MTRQRRAVAGVFSLLFFATSIHVSAKDGQSVAIALFDGPKGAAYVQITGVTVNGKTELRVCDGVRKIDKRTYETLPRTQLAGAALLERGNDGVLNLTANAKPVCVVPSNLKFDKNAELTPSEAAEQAVIQGTAVSASDPALNIPAFKPGVQLVFVLAPDSELADFLRARRGNSIEDWQEFLRHYPASTRVSDARTGMAAVYQRSAEAAFLEYQKLAGAQKPDFVLLKQAHKQAYAANQAFSGYPPAVRLIEAIGRELDAFLQEDRARLQVFRNALRDHGAGYAQLLAARQHLENLLEVRPEYQPLLNLRREVANEEQKFQAIVVNSESLLASGRYDEAVAALGAYATFAAEAPRVDSVLATAYRYHFVRGQDLANQKDWDQAAAEFRKTLAVRSTPEASSALDSAVTQVTVARNQQAAEQALRQSNEYASKNQFIEAYNVLIELPEAQRALVSRQLAALTNDYVTAASRRAQKLQEIHIPIKGRVDEDAVREAYQLLDRASTISGSPAVTLKRDFLSSKISSYYMEQANRYLEKPFGSGAGIGWLYLKEAQRYAITLNDVKDRMSRYGSLYQRRARLSIGLVLRDQTSRRNSVGFADQLADAIASGFESSGVPVEIVRRPVEGLDALQPNFMVVGEILEHRVVKNSALESLPSKYRAGMHEAKNPAWIQANSDYESAQQQLAGAQHELTEARNQHKKKEVIAATSDAVEEAQRRADSLRQKLESINPAKAEAIIEPYNYTKKTVNVSASIEVAFRINDRSGNVVEPVVDLHKDNHKTAVILENVKPEDTEGITKTGIEPDENQFLTDLEIEARNALVKSVREKASGLPAKILQEARSRAQRGDMDGAAEAYVLYLNATPEALSPERNEAAKFLHDQFNVTLLADSRQ